MAPEVGPEPTTASPTIQATLKRRRSPGIPGDPGVVSGAIALQAAINPKVVQERLGHASVNVTQDTCTHVLPPMHREAAPGSRH